MNNEIHVSSSDDLLLLLCKVKCTLQQVAGHIAESVKSWHEKLYSGRVRKYSLPVIHSLRRLSKLPFHKKEIPIIFYYVKNLQKEVNGTRVFKLHTMKFKYNN